MKLLALDTSTEQLSLAIMSDGKVVAFNEEVGNASSAYVLPKIQALLAEANITLNDLDGIAYGAGPGSFTGVRIATGVTQGLAFSHNLPVVGISTLLALAEASEAKHVIACLDARMGEVYHACYFKSGSNWETVIEPGVYKPEKVPTTDGTHWVGVGSGWKTYPEPLSNVYVGQLVAQQPDVMPMATAILALALPKFEAGQAKPAAEALPLYVRNRVALTTQQREAGERL